MMNNERQSGNGKCTLSIHMALLVWKKKRDPLGKIEGKLSPECQIYWEYWCDMSRLFATT